MLFSVLYSVLEGKSVCEMLNNLPKPLTGIENYKGEVRGRVGQ